jgi:FlaA1/EpsC-like NDP-sugar epimerase
MIAVRCGNVFASTGSVVPMFQQQILRGGPVTVTDPEVRRHFLSLDETVELIVAAAHLDDGGSIYVPLVHAPQKILDLALHLIKTSATDGDRDISIVFTGLRPGEKLEETFLSDRETSEPTANPRFRRICGPAVSPCEFDAVLAELEGAARRRDLPALVEILCRIVPEYRPSESLLEKVACSRA